MDVIKKYFQAGRPMLAVVICLAVLVGANLPGGMVAMASVESFLVTDMMGREVAFDGPAKSVVAIGPGALRLFTYFQETQMVIGIEQMDKDSGTGKPYVLANPNYAELPVIGAGGPNNAPDPEKLLAMGPDVIFTTYGSDKSAADNLQSKTGIPVVALSYGDIAVFDPILYDSIKLIGQVVAREAKAEYLIAYMEGLRLDLKARTENIDAKDRPSTYMGAVSMRGTHGIESTRGNYALFDAVNARNVVDELGITGSLMIDKEQLILWNPDIIFLDLGGLEAVRQDYKKNPRFYNILKAFQEGQVYGQLPYNYYTTNIDTAMADAYYIGKVLYPQQFTDIDPVAKADEIYTELLGKALYEKMAADYGGFMEITFDE